MSAPDNNPAPVVTIDQTKCNACGVCEAFCPGEVFELTDNKTMQAVRPSDCWGCQTCTGQCPEGAIFVEAPTSAALEDNLVSTEELPAPDDRLDDYAQTLVRILNLRFKPVAIKLYKAGQKMPRLPQPTERLRYCQAVIAARRGVELLLPVQYHACPDGTAILGMTAVPPKLRSGNIYVLFHKLKDLAAAQKLVEGRPHLPEHSVIATYTAPLASSKVTPDVVHVHCLPEQAMWLLMAGTFTNGERHPLQVAGYNAQCAEATVVPLQTGQINLTLGCYGCRASSDFDDSHLVVAIPFAKLPEVITSLQELNQKSIPQCRDKIYLGPFTV